MPVLTTAGLRRHAVAATLFPATTLMAAIERLGFVQCDPIRAPARAQDLILRHRVTGYRSGDLERHYPDLDLEEDYLYAYGVVSRATWRLLHPRGKKRLTQIEARIHELVCSQPKIHPRDLEPHFGSKRQINAWGSYSKATTQSLEWLHYYGLLRVAGREKGIRLYQAARPHSEAIAKRERLEQLILTVLRILQPAPERSLRAALRLFAYGSPNLPGASAALKELVNEGTVRSTEVDGIPYLHLEPLQDARAPNEVRFLAPFDPVVWDRYRFELLWGWAYRFEAYTPPAKRTMGYYALPLLWRDEIIGWVNVDTKTSSIKIEAGYVDRAPATRSFRSAFDDEVERLKQFLG